MNQYDQLVQFEDIALSIFHKIKRYIPAKVLLKYLQETHPDFLDKRYNQPLDTGGKKAPQVS